MARMKRNMIWPSGWPQRDPAATKATPVPFSMISMDIRIKIRLRRIRSPASPSANKIPARMSACSIGIPVISTLSFLEYRPPQMASSHQGAQQQHGREFHADEVRPVQREPHLFRIHNATRELSQPGPQDQIEYFRNQDCG